MEILWPSVLGPMYDGEGVSADWLEELNAAVQTPSPRAVRIAPDNDLELPFETKPVAWFERGRELPDVEVRPGAYLHHSAGCYYVQDAGSLLSIALGDIQPGQRVCDLCAAPGGKSTALLEELKGSGVLLSNEVIGSRLGPLTTALARTGFANYITTNQDVQRLSKSLTGEFDCVLVDAPCSGQSMYSKGKQTEAAFSEHQIAHSAARQQRIVRCAAEMVRPGGRLVYSTCTFAYEENELVIEQFLREFPEWAIADTTASLMGYHSPRHAGCYRLWPHRHPCAGGFAAALVRRDDTLTTTPPRRKSRSKWKPMKKPPDSLRKWTDEDAFLKLDPSRIFSTSGRLEYISPLVEDHWIDLAYSAVPLANSKHNRWEPAYASSLLSLAALHPRERIQLDDLQAIRFVAGEPIRSTFDLASGTWCQVIWRGRPLAWGKYAGGVLKNHMPKHLRQAVVAK